MAVEDACKGCGAPLSAEGRLLSAIFGDGGLCIRCVEKENMPKCTVCGEPTNLGINGEPRCKVHMEARQD